MSKKDLKKNKIDLLIHGNDLKNIADKPKVKILKRTKNISSSKIRRKSYLIYRLLKKNETQATKDSTNVITIDQSIQKSTKAV